MPKPSLAILAYAFPPSRAVGALRPFYLAKQLVGAGWEVTVVTPNPSFLAAADTSGPTPSICRDLGIRLAHTDHRLRFLLSGWLKGPLSERRLLTSAAVKLVENLEIEPSIGWKSGLEETMRRLPRQDAIIATGPPFFAFRTAVETAARTGAASVLEYRDLWTESPHALRRGSRALRATEDGLLACADAVWTISPSMSEVLSSRVRGQLRTLPNGFDPDDFSGLAPRVFEHRALVYAGSFYPPKRVIDPLLLALIAANRKTPRGDRLFLHYFGGNGGVVRERANHFGCAEYIRDEGHVPRTEVLCALKGCAAAAVIVSVLPTGDASDATIVTAKLFEALGAGAPILLIAPPRSDARAVLAGPGVGAAFTGNDTESMASWLRGVRRTDCPKSASVVERWTWASIGEAAGGALAEVIAKRRDRRA